MQKRFLLPLLIIALLLGCAASTQFQPLVLKNMGASGGSFGIQPMSHSCAGLRLDRATIGWLPLADSRIMIGRFSVRYYVEDGRPGRVYCLGQDIRFP